MRRFGMAIALIGWLAANHSPAQEIDAGVASIAAARSAVGGTVVRLEGVILSADGAGSYMLGDETGEIEARIKPYLTDNVAIAPMTRVRLTGEVRQRPLGPHLDAGIVEMIE
ncbi:MAG: NirD/YgiW/YdeI family stress tolerance protein [Pikeienuella sp.]